jgi:putative membrane protein
MMMGSDLSRRAESARLASAPAHQSFQFRPLRSPVRNCDTARAASRTGAARECARRALAARKSGNRRRGPSVGTSVAIVPRAHRGRAAAQRSEIPTESHRVLPEVGGHRGPLTCTVGVRADDKKPVDFDDVAFTIIATSCGLHEIELGKVVEKKSTNAEVKAFAAQVVKDHTAINEELKVAAKSARISISQKMDDAHQKQLDAFEDYKGTNFDGDYLKHTAEKHKQFVALLKRASKEAKNKELRDFATKNLPTVEGHIEKANKLIK